MQTGITANPTEAPACVTSPLAVCVGVAMMFDLFTARMCLSIGDVLNEMWTAVSVQLRFCIGQAKRK